MSFINFSKLNAQAKNAWKMDQLIIGLYQNGYIIGTGRLLLWSDRDHAPNKLLSIIAEYAGFIPVSNDKAFRLGKNKEAEFMDLSYIGNINDLRLSKHMQRYGMSPIQIKDTHDLSLIQNKSNLLIKGLRVEFKDLIDDKDVDYEIESDPAGPLTTDDPNGLIYYQNGICWIAFANEQPAKELSKQIVGPLHYISITQEVK